MEFVGNLCYALPWAADRKNNKHWTFYDISDSRKHLINKWNKVNEWTSTEWQRTSGDLSEWVIVKQSQPVSVSQRPQGPPVTVSCHKWGKNRNFFLNFERIFLWSHRGETRLVIVWRLVARDPHTVLRQLSLSWLPSPAQPRLHN